MFSHSISFKLPHAPFHDVSSNFGSAFDLPSIKSFRQLLSHEDKSRDSDSITAHETKSGGNPPKGVHRLSRKISAPCLISSTHILTESWYISFGSAHNIRHIASEFVSDIKVGTPLHVAGDPKPVFDKLAADMESPTVSQHLPNVRIDITLEDDHRSIYSEDSADPDLHGFLLSIPIIPKIKLERKATIKEPDKVPEQPKLNAERESFLSPPGFRPHLVRSSSDRHLLRPRGVADLKNLANVLNDAKEPGSSTGEVFAPHGQITSPPLGHHRTDWSGTGEFHSALTYRPSVSLPALNARRMSAYGKEVTIFEENKTMRASSQGDGIQHDDAKLSHLVAPSYSLVTPRFNGHPVGFAKRGHRRPLPPLPNKEQRARSNGILSCLQARTSRFLKYRSSSSPRILQDPDGKWAPKDGMIIVKVFVTSTSDIWKIKVPEDINLQRFTCKVLSKLGFHVAFSGSCWDSPEYFFKTDASFRHWLDRRVRFGRNLPLVAHVVDPPAQQSMG